MIIRLAKMDDLDRVHEIEVSAMSHPWTYDNYVEAFNEKNAIFVVAEDDGSAPASVVGFVLLYIGADQGDIPDVVVEKSYRNRHVASDMLEFLYQQAVNRGVQEIFLEVRQSNNPAIALYRHQGFEPIGERKHFYQDPDEDAIVMRKKF